ncbi:Rhodanese-like domain-containing protein [Biscogniauxia sp. FL1348]|nr:Rhodanese-like domain-containing protein [Biscogniauxia sp. FL1348]
MAPPRHQLLALGIRSTARSTGSTIAARAGATTALRTFGSSRTPRGAGTAAAAPRTTTKTLPQPRAISPILATTPGQRLGTGIRWSSNGEGGGAENRKWTFEEISALSSSTSSSPSESSSPPSSSPSPSPESPTTTTTPPKPAVLIDVREAPELAATGRIPGALHVPISSAPDSFHISADDFAARYGFARPPRDRALVFYCKAGVRSRAAATLARAAGWADVGEYPGSWVEWERRGGKVER